MNKLLIQGPQAIQGAVDISCAKNAYLPLMVCTLLTEDALELVDPPLLRDVSTLKKVLSKLGVSIFERGNILGLQSDRVSSYEATYELVKTMRASILVLGPLLARFGKAKVSLPGGCAIGQRPINIHLDNFIKMGAEVNITGGYVEASVPGGRLKGTTLELEFPSVGATENLVSAAVLASGQTIIKNAACEPEIIDLCSLLRKMGAKIKGEGSSEIIIDGVSTLSGTKHRPIGDRIEAATFLFAALATKGELEARGVRPEFLGSVIEFLEKHGARFEVKENSIRVLKSDMIPFTASTEVYPGIPTDVQAQLMALALSIEGESKITETVFENRFMHVSELQRMGANITIEGNTAIIQGGEKLSAAPVMCTDLRASAALVMAGLMAEGETELSRIYHLDRGYEFLEKKMEKLGAQIRRVEA